MQHAASRGQLACEKRVASILGAPGLPAAHWVRRASSRAPAWEAGRFAGPCRRRWAVTCHRDTPHSHQHQHHVSLHAKSEASEPLEVLLSQDISASGSYDHDHEEGGHGHGSGTAHQHHHHGPDLEANAVSRVLTWVYRHTGLLRLAELLRESLYGSVAITVLFAVAAVCNWQSGSAWLAQRAADRLRDAAVVAVYVLAGVPAAVDLTYDLASLHVDTHVLMTLAVIGTLLIGGALEGALLLVLFQVSHTVEHMLTSRATGDLRALFEGIPEAATLVDLVPDGKPDMATQREEPVRRVDVGATMLVKPGETVPLDGEILYGEALLSMQHITGENLPIRRAPGAQVPAGSQCHDGVLVLRVTQRAEDSTPARISRLARDAQASKPQLRAWVDEVGEVYSKAVIAATALALLVLPLAGVPLLSTATQRGAIYRSMGLLTTASPCALVLVPLAYVSAIAAITSRGMLIKGGRVLDALATCRTVAFDKTGTLTTGDLMCTSMTSPESFEEVASAVQPDTAGTGWVSDVAHGGSASDHAALAAAVELSLRSNHPVSRAMARCGHAAGGKLPHVDIKEFKAVPGAGVQGEIAASNGAGASPVRFGSAEFAAEVLPRVQGAALARAAAAVGRDNAVSVLVRGAPGKAADVYGEDAIVRLFTFQDTLNDRSTAAVEALLDGRWEGSRQGRDAKHVVMLTGDNPASAQRIARLLGISDVRAGLAPWEKLEAVKSLRSPPAPRTDGTSDRHAAGQRHNGNGVIMVGDGINDAPALAAADVGVAVAATPRDAAASAADIVLLSGSGVAALPFLLGVAERTQAIIKQNMCLALGSIAALALPVLLGWLPLWVAVTLHEGSTLLVAINSLRLLRWDDSAEAQLAVKDAAATAKQSMSVDQQAARSHEAVPEPVLAAAAA